MEKQNLKKSIKFWVILFLVLFFGGNAIKFVTTKGSQHPLLSSLFKMIISLVCLIFVFHRKYAKFMMRQTKIEEFFLSTNDELLNFFQ